MVSWGLFQPSPCGQRAFFVHNLVEAMTISVLPLVRDHNKRFRSRNRLWRAGSQSHENCCTVRETRGRRENCGMSLKRHLRSGSSDRANKGHEDLGWRSWKRALEQRRSRKLDRREAAARAPICRVRAAGRSRRMKSEPAPWAWPGKGRCAQGTESSVVESAGDKSEPWL